jgi:3-dehydroquinate dehydratase-2
MKLMIINGPNLNLVGTREPSIYGSISVKEYFKELQLNRDVSLEYFQTNSEGEIIDKLQSATCDGIILNAGAYSHTSIAIRDCISAIKIPVIEVHISNIAARESFRHDSVLSPVCKGTIFGFGLKGYELAILSFTI